MMWSKWEGKNRSCSLPQLSIFSLAPIFMLERKRKDVSFPVCAMFVSKVSLSELFLKQDNEDTVRTYAWMCGFEAKLTYALDLGDSSG